MNRAEIEAQNPCNYCEKTNEERELEEEPCEKWYSWEKKWQKVVWKET